MHHAMPNLGDAGGECERANSRCSHSCCCPHHPPPPPSPTSSPRPSSHMLASATTQIYRKQADRTARGLSPSPDVHLPQVFLVGGLPNQPVRVALHRQRQAGLGAHAQQRARQPACVWAVCVCDCTQRVLERL